MKSKLYQFNPVIYPFPLLVTKDYDLLELKNTFYIVTSKTDCQEIDNQLDDAPNIVAKTCCVLNKKTNQMFYLVLFSEPEHIRIDEITHEALHVTMHNADWVGLGDPVPGNDEPYAYFCGWVAGCCDSVLKDKQYERGAKLYSD